jgi:polysaccharide export outer membrane protein
MTPLPASFQGTKGKAGQTFLTIKSVNRASISCHGPGFVFMRVAKFLMPVLAALAAAGCARQQQSYYVIDPATGQPVPVVQQYYSAPRYAQAGYAQPAPQYAKAGGRGLYSSPQVAQQAYAQSSYAPPAYQPPAPQPQYAPSTGRGLYNLQSSYGQPRYAPQPYQSYVLQYHPPAATGGPYVPAPYGYAYAPSGYQRGYTLDSGDKLRVVVFGQEGISGSYTVDAGGNVSLPLVGTVPARGFTTQQLAREITERLKQGYVREPHVTVTIDAYRPFFILGEVTTPGQYPFVPNMTVENAVAVAGGFSPRAQKQTVEITRNTNGQRFTGDVPLNYPMRPGDTIVVKERWF